MNHWGFLVLLRLLHLGVVKPPVCPPRQGLAGLGFQQYFFTVPIPIPAKAGRHSICPSSVGRGVQRLNEE